MPKKWNLQDIRPAGGGRERMRRPIEEPRSDVVPRVERQAERPRIDPDLASIDIVDGKVRRKKRIIVSVIVALLIIAAGFGSSMLMSGAEITVYPKFKDSTVQATFVGYIEPKAGELPYELLKLEANGEKQVSATGEEMVSERARGSMLIYNGFSASPQRLIKNTRFESKDGLIYRISESVEVPGYTVDDKGNKALGVVTAEVFAEGTGEQYNIAPGRFTIPGLKGSEQYETMYGESTETFTGGFEGKRFIIEDGELQTAKQALHMELRDALLARLEQEKPNGFIVYKDAVTFAFDSLPATEYGDKLATIKEQARLQVPIFKEADFSTYLAQNTIAGYEGEPVYVEDPYSLKFSYPAATTTTSDISAFTDLEFNLSGNTRIIWHFDEDKLRTDLAGIGKTGIDNVLSGYPAIMKAESVVRPFWAQSLPESTEGIEIITVIGENAEKSE